MEINEVLEEVKTIVEERKVVKDFNYPISKLKNNFKNNIWHEPKEINQKPNPIMNLSWYRDMVGEVNKRATIINTDSNFYRFGVYIKFNRHLSIKYRPYVIKEGGKCQESRALCYDCCISGDSE